MAAPVLKFKRGNLADLPALAVGEPGFTIDKFDLYLGSSSGNQFVGSGRFWSTETASAGSAVNIFEATANGTNKISLKAPTNIASDVELIFPAAQGAVSSVLTNDGSGNLSWASGSANPVFTGIATFNTSQVDVNSTVTISGITTFESTEQSFDKDSGAVVIEGGVGVEKNLNVGGILAVTGLSTFTDAVKISSTTESTDKDTGALIVEGGVGVEKNLSVGGATTVTGNLFVGGQSEFVGVVTFRGGLINLGDSNTDDIVIGGEFASDLIPTTDDTHSLGSASNQWKDLFINGHAELDNVNISGIVTAFDLDVDGHAEFDAIRVSGVSTFTGAIDANGGADISGGETTLSSATISDLTAGRVVLAGTAGSLEDDGSLTFSDTTGLVVSNSGINVTGVSTFSTDVVIGGDVRINGNDIQASDGNTNITLTSNTLTTFAGDIKVGGNDIQASDGNTNITMTSNTLTTVAGDLKVTGNDIQDSGGNAALTFDGSQNVTANQSLTVTGTLIANGDVDLGNAVTDSITATGRFDSSLIPLNDGAVDLGTASNEWRNLFIDGTAEIDALNVSGVGTVATVRTGTIQASDGTAAITIADTTGNVTLNGSLTVLGTQTIVNTETLKVEDSLIEIGLVNSAGDLVAPSSDADIDVGTIFHYHTGSAAKKAAVFWDDSEQRIGIGSDVTESTSVLTVAHYASIQIQGLWVTDCAGTSQVISCSGGTRNLENITIDGGTFV